MTLALDTCSKQTEPPVKTTSDNTTPQTGYSPFIDKISVTLTIPHEDIATIYERVLSAINCTSIFQHAQWSRGFKICRNIALSGTEERVLFQFGAKTTKGPDCRLGIQPCKGGVRRGQQLRHILTEILPDGWFYVLKHGRVSRIDVAVDLPGMRMDDFLLLPQQGIVYQRFLSNGHLKTVYLGAPGGNQIRVYSKSAEQKAKGLTVSQPAVRVERTLRNQDLKVHELKMLKNPFDKLTFVPPMPPPPPGESEKRWSSFQDSVQVRGLSAALAMLPEKRRTRYRKHLKQNPAMVGPPGHLEALARCLDVIA